MNKKEIKQDILTMLSILDDDGESSSSRKLTDSVINSLINKYYRGIIIPYLNGKVPTDLLQTTTRIPTYMVTGTVSASSDSTSFVSTTAVMAEWMVGEYIQGSDGDLIQITGYTSPTQVTLAASVPSAWEGAAFYVLGDKIIFEGISSMDDHMSTWGVEINYSGSEGLQVPAEYKSYKSLQNYHSPTVYSPSYYDTSVNYSGRSSTAIGFYPRFNDKDGWVEITYTSIAPILLHDDDIPRFANLGMGEAISKGVQADGAYILGFKEDVPNLKVEFEFLKRQIVRNYKKFQGAGSKMIGIDKHYQMIRRGR